jgi:membrane protein DedA with SNARE-associated domain
VEDLIHEYRYIALMIGTFFEGETAIILASSLIHKGMFNAAPTVAFAFMGSFISDWIYYFIGRLNGKLFIERRPKLQAKLLPVTGFFQRNKIQILFTYRFLYGFRVIIPLIIGMSNIRPTQYLFFSIIAGLFWAGTVTTLGYVIGRLFGVSAHSIQENIVLVLAGFATFGIALGYVVQKIVRRNNLL